MEAVFARQTRHSIVPPARCETSGHPVKETRFWRNTRSSVPSTRCETSDPSVRETRFWNSTCHSVPATGHGTNRSLARETRFGSSTYIPAESSASAFEESAASSFEELVGKLLEVHTEGVQAAQKESADKVNLLKEEVAGLRARLGEAGISFDDVKLLPHAEEAEFAKSRCTEFEDQVGKSFEIKDEWMRTLETNTWGRKLNSLVAKRYLNTGNFDNSSCDSGESMFSHEESEKKPFACIINPNDNFRLCWDLCGLILICFDMCAIPFSMAFLPPTTAFSEFMNWFTLVFWSLDMAQGFFLGYYEDGFYVVDHRRIVMQYLRSWFLVDLLVVGPEWLIVIAGSFLSNQEMGVNAFAKLIKGTRVIRVLRLLRLLKLQRIMTMLYDLIESEWTFICLSLGRMLLFVVVFNHGIACLWYWIGRVHLEAGTRNWIAEGNVEGSSMTYRYTTSLHWSLTQFTPASIDISARNTWERIFSIIVLFFALVTFSSIVASITGSTTTLRNMKTDELKQFWLLRRYARQRDVSNDLITRIFKFLEHQQKSQRNLIQEGSVTILSGLSEALKDEMSHQMNSPHLVNHPLFLNIDTNMKAVMQRLCGTVLKNHALAEKEVVFHWGDVATRMYFLKYGSFVYTKLDGMQVSPPLGPKDWVGEPVLWTSWRHQGDLMTNDASELISAEPIAFLQVMSVHPRPWYFAKHYAAAFVRMLNSIDRLDLSDVIRDNDFYKRAVRESEDIFAADRRSLRQRSRMFPTATVSDADCEEDETATQDTEASEVQEVDEGENRSASLNRARFRFWPCAKGAPSVFP